MEQLSMASFLRNGHPFHLYVYDDLPGVPKGVVLKDANQIIPERKIFKYKDFDSCAGFSNLFRYRLLLEKGSYWADLDVVCLRPFSADSEYVFCKQRDPGFLRPVKFRQPFFSVANCVIKAPIDSVIMRYCYDQSAARDPEALMWGKRVRCWWPGPSRNSASAGGWFHTALTAPLIGGTGRGR